MSPRRMNSRQQPLIGYWEFLAVATGLVCITTGSSMVMSRHAPGRILGHEGAGVTRRLRSGRIPAAVSGTSKRSAPITGKGLIPNLFQMFHMFLWVLAPGQALAAAWRLNWS